jgi:hypothetical protein
VIAFFTVFSVAASPAARANDSNNLPPVELKFIGNINNQQIFQLNFAGNAEENDFTINVKDEAGNSLYMENIKGEIFYKKFLLNNDEIGDGKILFEVTSKKTNKTVVFEVKNQSRVVEEMVIKKIN